MKISRTKRYSTYKNLVLRDEKSNKFKFLNDGRIYYVYRITDTTSNEYYYGSGIKRLEDIKEDFWSYCTSSKRKKIIKENKENYKVKILRLFNNANDMIIYESFLHQFFNVKNHKRFFNENNQNPWNWNNGGMTCVYDELNNIKWISNTDPLFLNGTYKHISKNKALSKESRKLISDAVKKMWKDEKYRKKQSESHKGYITSNKTKIKISKALKGVSKPEGFGVGRIFSKKTKEKNISSS